jgi:hypothetical protein
MRGGKRVNAMAEDALKEVAAAREKHRGTRLASGEFFYLVERIDRLDEKMSDKIDSKIEGLDTKLTGEIRALDTKLTGRIESLDTKLTGDIRALDTKLTGRIESLDVKLTGKIESEVKSLSDKFTTTQHWMIGLFVAAIGVIVAILLHH